MKTSKTFLEWTKTRFEEIGRARAWAILRTIEPERLEQAGIEPRLLKKGPDAWPWRAETQGSPPSVEFSIDERGAPVPIELTDEVDGLAVRTSPRGPDDDSTPLAA